MGWEKKVHLYKDSEPVTVLTDDRLGYEGYIEESNRLNNAIIRGRLHNCTNYIFQDHVVLTLMDN